MNWINCSKCSMQIAESAVETHRKLNHPKRQGLPPSQVVINKLVSSGHYHKGRRGKCNCEEKQNASGSKY